MSRLNQECPKILVSSSHVTYRWSISHLYMTWPIRSSTQRLVTNLRETRVKWETSERTEKNKSQVRKRVKWEKQARSSVWSHWELWIPHLRILIFSMRLELWIPQPENYGLRIIDAAPENSYILNETRIMDTAAWELWIENYGYRTWEFLYSQAAVSIRLQLWYRSLR